MKSFNLNITFSFQQRTFGNNETSGIWVTLFIFTDIIKSQWIQEIQMGARWPCQKVLLLNLIHHMYI